VSDDRGPLADHFTDLIAKIGEHCADDSDILYIGSTVVVRDEDEDRTIVVTLETET